MRNLFKRTLTLAMSLIMVMSMGVFAFADANQCKVSIDSNHGEFTAYKVINATQTGTDSANKPVYKYEVNPDFANFFGNATYGGYTLTEDGIKNAAGAVIKDTGFANTKTTEEAKLASYLEKFVNDNPTISGTTVGKTETSVDKGLYLISERLTAADTKNGYVSSKPILADLTTDKLAIKAKDNQIELDKKIGVDGDDYGPTDANKDKYTLEENNKNVGDTINYYVSSKIPEYKVDPGQVLDKEKLVYEFSDTFTNINFKADSMVVKVSKENGDPASKILTADTDYTLTPAAKSFKLALKGATIDKYQGYDIELFYQGVLNQDAVVNDTNGNPNKVELKYSNNPNDYDSFDTLKDEVKTFTYGFKIHKVDKDNDNMDLEGAEFTVTDKKTGKALGVFTYENGQIVAKGDVKTDAQGLASLSGLDEGTYVITETKAPAGYSMLSTPVEVVIKDNGGAKPTGIATITATGGGSPVVEVGTSAGTGQIDLIVKIKNSKGIALPETGSKSALYCMIGGIMMLILGGAAFGFTRKFAK